MPARTNAPVRSLILHLLKVSFFSKAAFPYNLSFARLVFSYCLYCVTLVLILVREDPYAMFLVQNAEALKSPVERHRRQAYILDDDVGGSRCRRRKGLAGILSVGRDFLHLLHVQKYKCKVSHVFVL